MIKITDNALDLKYFDLISSTVKSTFFPWYYKTESTQKGENLAETAESYYGYQFTHMLYFNQIPMSEHFENLMIPVLEVLNCFSLVRMSVNFMPPMSENKLQGFHTDSPTLCKSAVLYLNTNNGKTVFENGDEIESVANRLIVFDSNLRHSGMTTTDLCGRYVLNVLFFQGDNSAKLGV